VTSRELAPEDLDYIVARYDAGIAYADAQLLIRCSRNCRLSARIAHARRDHRGSRRALIIR
jgi:hypothetical protein